MNHNCSHQPIETAQAIILVSGEKGGTDKSVTHELLRRTPAHGKLRLADKPRRRKRPKHSHR